MPEDHLETHKLNFILASQSPRRKELLSWLSVPFRQISSNIEEISNKTKPYEIAIDLAVQKGEAVASKCSKNEREKSLTLSSDTIVCLDNGILGKPKDREEARQMLLKLSGNKHTVYTGVALRLEHPHFGQSPILKNFYSKTVVQFLDIDQQTLELYLETNDSLDKAGAYGIQGMGLSFIKSIDGSYSNVVGLPLAELSCELKQLLEKPPLVYKSWREWFTKA